MTETISDRPNLLADGDAAHVLAAAQQIWPPGPDFHSEAASAVRRVVGADVVTFNRLNLRLGTREVVIDPPHRRAAMLELQDTIQTTIYQHPLVGHILEAGEIKALRLSDRMPQEQWRQTDLFRTYYQPLGLLWQMVLPVPSGDEYINVIALNRSDRDFTDRDVAVCEAFLPILALGCGGAPADVRGDTAAGWLFVQLDSAGTITRVSPDDAGGILVPGCQLPTPSDTGTTGQDIERVELSDGFWMIRRIGGSDGSTVLAARRLPPAHLTLPTLTDRQREVLRLIAAGHTNDRIAHELGIALGTVRKHVENILSTLGTPNRAAAAALWTADRAEN